MSEELATPPPRSYGCSFGCGNPYDYIIIAVQDSETQLLCMPCFMRLARDMLAAALDANDPGVLAAISYLNSQDDEHVPGPEGAPRGRNAPANSEDRDLFEAYDGRLTFDELPDEFK